MAEAVAGTTGVRIGVDVGSVRVGVAASDAAGVLASPVATLARDTRAGRDLDELAAIVAERSAVEVIVGLPRLLSGRNGVAVDAARCYAAEVARRVAPVPVRLVDERLTTVVADQQLRAAGRGGRAASRLRRQVIDQVAAVAILQSALDARRAPAQIPPGWAQ